MRGRELRSGRIAHPHRRRYPSRVPLPCLYHPDLLFTDGTLRSDAVLAVDASGNVTAKEALPEDTPTVRLAGRALLPGLVNAHSHAFQRLLRGRAEHLAAAGEGASVDDFWSWRERMYRAANALDPDDLYVASRQVFCEMALAGVTTVGEFHYLHHTPEGRPYAEPDALALAVVRAAREVGLRIALLRVGYARSGHATPPNPLQRRFIDPTVDDFLSAAARLSSKLSGDPLVTVGLAPHSVRAVPREWLEAVRSATDGKSGPVVHMHLSEQPKEISACANEHGLRPVELVHDVGLLSERFTAVHAIHLSPDEERMLGEARATVCACPSTERNLGDGVVPADRLLETGAHLALGTDGQTQIDLLEDARQLESHLRLIRLRRCVLDPGGGDPDGLVQRLLGFATRGGARSLGLEGGSLAAGEAADFFTLALDHPALAGADSLGALLFGATVGAVRDVAVCGKRIVEDGRHPLAETSGRAFTALARRIF